MRSLRAMIGFALVVSALLGGAGSASARGVGTAGSEEACPIGHVILNVTYSCALEFSLRGTNGYEVTVSADPGTGSTPVSLTAEGPSGSAQYMVNGRATASGISASFGKLGKVDVRFLPSGATRRKRVPKCQRERPPVVSSKLGSFVGTIVFRGERGYTRVDAHRVAGAVGDPLSNQVGNGPECDFHGSPAQLKREEESVSLQATGPRTGLSFSTFRLFGGGSSASALSAVTSPTAHGQYLFFVLAVEKLGKVTVFRSTGAPAAAGDFVFDEALTTARVSPPAPFTGTGTFARGPDGSVSWTGDLAVSLPGLGRVHLIGGKAELATVATLQKQFEVELEKH